MSLFIDAMIFLGSALMVINIWRYVRYTRNITKGADWSRQRVVLQIPLVLLVFFLIGYIVVGLFGKPDILMASILLGGSIFVAIIVNTLERITLHIQETEHLEAKLMASEESSRAKTAFMSNMSHEIRTPMNAIIGISSIALKDETLKPETRDQFKKIDASARHLLALINDVLDMNRIESGRMQVKSEPIAMDELVEQVNTIIQSQCDDKGIEFMHGVYGREGLPGFDGPCCMGDGVKVRQVLINILGNAVKFTPEGGRVSFTIEADNCSARAACGSDCDRGCCHVRFIISDTGVGMDEDFIPKVFDTFVQEDESSTNRYGGSGLGMSITKNLVDMMGGTIEVKSKKGEGTTFIVGLDFAPLTEEARAAADHMITEVHEAREEGAAEAAEKTGPKDVAGCNILIAEDVDLNAEILADILEMEEMTSERAENGRIAVDMFAGSEPGKYDAILMDMRMPVMDGVSAAKAIRAMQREDAKTIPIIALTANAFDEDIELCLNAGMNAHMTKPVDPELLVETLGRHL